MWEQTFHSELRLRPSFLLQEFFREITTLGNKAPSPDLSALVVKFKTELEKLREQVQNVE